MTAEQMDILLYLVITVIISYLASRSTHLYLYILASAAQVFLGIFIFTANRDIYGLGFAILIGGEAAYTIYKGIEPSISGILRKNKKQ